MRSTQRSTFSLWVTGSGRADHLDDVQRMAAAMCLSSSTDIGICAIFAPLGYVDWFVGWPVGRLIGIF